MILSKMFYSYDKDFYFAPRMLYYRQVLYGIYATGFDSYSPVRGRKHFSTIYLVPVLFLIHIAPLGDGNSPPHKTFSRRAHFDSYSPVRGRKLQQYFLIFLLL